MYMCRGGGGGGGEDPHKRMSMTHRSAAVGCIHFPLESY